jgi:hypothetical protein
MEFLYSLNRLNVATSRARCLAVIVGSPELLKVVVHTPRQMSWQTRCAERWKWRDLRG